MAEITNKHFVSDAIIALAAEKKSLETFYLIRITKEYDTKEQKITMILMTMVTEWKLAKDI